MTSETTPVTGAYLAASLGTCVWYAKALLADVEPDSFARMPMANFNHAAFNYGHLALYPNKMLELIGRTDAQLELPFGDDLYGAGVECVEQDGRYQSMDVITSAFFEGHDRLLEILPTIDPTVMEIELPEGRAREMFTTVGNAVTFMSCSHTMMHLGQVSMWRRAMGLGSCM